MNPTGPRTPEGKLRSRYNALYLNRIERSIKNNLQALEAMQQQRRREAEASNAKPANGLANREFVFSNPQDAAQPRPPSVQPSGSTMVAQASASDSSPTSSIVVQP